MGHRLRPPETTSQIPVSLLAHHRHHVRRRLLAHQVRLAAHLADDSGHLLGDRLGRHLRPHHGRHHRRQAALLLLRFSSGSGDTEDLGVLHPYRGEEVTLLVAVAGLTCTCPKLAGSLAATAPTSLASLARKLSPQTKDRWMSTIGLVLVEDDSLVRLQQSY